MLFMKLQYVIETSWFESIFVCERTIDNINIIRLKFFVSKLSMFFGDQFFFYLESSTIVKVMLIFSAYVKISTSNKSSSSFSLFARYDFSHLNCCIEWNFESLSIQNNETHTKLMTSRNESDHQNFLQLARRIINLIKTPKRMMNAYRGEKCNQSTSYLHQTLRWSLLHDTT